jgi:subtilisin-like proprotein convertase family protein
MFSNRSVTRLFTISLIVCVLLVAFPRFNSQAQDDDAKQPDTVFSNTSPITINTAPTTTAPTVASLYPSTINVSGVTGTITRVAVTLRGLTHTRITNVDFLLVSPTGAKFVFLSDPVNTDSFLPVNDSVFTFADDATSAMTNFAPPIPGTYKPTNNDTSDTFPLPAPAAPYNFPPSATFASTFNGADPNGTWSLYAVDDEIVAAGSINSGWNLTITTTGSPQTFSNTNYIGLDDTVTRATPYASTINVSGQSGVISNLRVTLTGVSHTFSQEVDMLLVSPNGRSLILLSDAGASAITNVNLTFDDSAPGGVSQTSITSGTYKPTNYSDGFFENGDAFPNPAPLRPYIESFSSQLSSFNGFSPNGEWKLFVTDDRGNSNSGTISGGWSLDITTSPLQLPPIGCFAPSFAVTTNTSVGTNPTNLAIGDFNNDNRQDLVVTNQVSNDVSILLGNGNGTFAPQTLLTAGSGPYDVAVGRFNADSNDDLAVVNSTSNNVSILLGNGNGTFSAPTNFLVGASPISVAVADFNNDAKQDLAVANFGGFFSGAVSILLGNGIGGFNPPTTVRTRTQPSYVATGNFNGDSNTDLVVANFGADSISVFFGIGGGALLLNQNLATGAGPVAIDVTNINADSFPDLIVANYNADSYTTFFGSANGVFSAGGNSSVGSNPVSLVAGNFLAGNNTNQIALALSGVNQVVIPLSFFVVGSNPNAIVKGDFNGDSLPDLVTANAGSNDLSIMRNSCSVAKGNLFDFNGDRKTDFSAFRPIPASWFVAPSGVSQLTFGRDTDKIVPADYDGDSLTDFAIYRPESGLWFSVKTGTIHFLLFGLPTDIPTPADFDGDRKADIAVFRPSDGTWYIRRSTDNSLQISQWGMNNDKPVAADYDGDGKADLAVFRPSNGVWYILRSSDNQITFTNFGISTDKTIPNDYDGDGKADIAVYRDSIWYVLRSSDGGFSAIGFGTLGDIPVPGDYDADGKFDFAIFRPSDTNWWVMRSSDGGIQVVQFGVSTDVPLPSTAVR